MNPTMVSIPVGEINDAIPWWSRCRIRLGCSWAILLYAATPASWRAG